MNRSETIKRAVFNMGGRKIAGITLQVSTSTISKWIRNGVIPSLDKAKQVAEISGFDVALLRPYYTREAM
jgi:transcriptional regulator with XRE-family HTH domain